MENNNPAAKQGSIDRHKKTGIRKTDKIVVAEPDRVIVAEQLNPNIQIRQMQFQSGQ